MKFSIIVPIYNERATAAVLLDAVLAAPLPTGLEKEVIVVEGRSTDGTTEVVRGYEGRPGVRVLYRHRAIGYLRPAPSDGGWSCYDKNKEKVALIALASGRWRVCVLGASPEDSLDFEDHDDFIERVAGPEFGEITLERLDNLEKRKPVALRRRPDPAEPLAAVERQAGAQIRRRALEAPLGGLQDFGGKHAVRASELLRLAGEIGGTDLVSPEDEAFERDEPEAAELL